MIKNNDIKFYPNTKCSISNNRAYNLGEAYELCKVYYENNIVENILTIKCNKCLHCDCSINSMLKLLHKTRLKNHGPHIKIEKYVTRRKKQGHVYIHAIYGLVDETVEDHINNLWKQIWLIKSKQIQKTESRQIETVKKEIDKYQRKYGHLINSTISHYFHEDQEDNFYYNDNE